MKIWISSMEKCKLKLLFFYLTSPARYSCFLRVFSVFLYMTVLICACKLKYSVRIEILLLFKGPVLYYDLFTPCL